MAIKSPTISSEPAMIVYTRPGFITRQLMKVMELPPERRERRLEFLRRLMERWKKADQIEDAENDAEQKED
jgi:hypothetical protein